MTLINLSPHFYEAQACEVTPVFFIASACYFEIFSQSRDGRLDKINLFGKIRGEPPMRPKGIKIG